ncbi:HSP20 family protein [Dongia mobilis]|uniref:HSP20 family protein n=1 Tax=Dongia mobilis TaxID=578943 RepID=A0A4R6WL40_9PROT|nr:Hsp20/alpha crystallin family protein [Dongia mobilis]TDQ78961.1 HSP20 family protein [Dongia mobilis]
MAFRALTPFGRGGVAPRPERNDPLAWRGEFDRLFDDMFKGFGALPSVWGEGAAAPKIDVKETDAGIEVTAELPGVDEKDVTVELADDLLTIRGEKKMERKEEDKEKGYHLMERSYGSFQRSLRLPYACPGEKVEAEFNKGVLRITCPRPAEVAAKTRKIDIKSR